MSIAISDRKIQRLYCGSSEISKVYLGDDLVYQKGANINNYIEIVVDSTSGTFIVPFSCFGYEGGAYSVHIYVNGEFLDTAEGTSPYFYGNGYTLTGLTGQTATIRLEPTGDPIPGWARGFGFSSHDKGCNSDTNKAKLLSVINDPDYSHLQSYSHTGNNFRSYQYYGCTSLIEPVPETLPDSVEAIGDNFRRSQYGSCSSLRTVSPEVLPHSVTTIGDEFRGYQYVACNSITATAPEVMPNSVISIGDRFRCYQYTVCSALTTLSQEVLSDSITDIGEGFRRQQYSVCILLTTPVEEYLPDSVITIGDAFRESQYAACSALTKPAAEFLPASVTTIGYLFRGGQYSRCSSLITPAAEYFLDSIEHISYGFRANQYNSCSSLTTTAVEFIPDSVTTIDDGFREEQYYDCISLLIGNHIHSYHFPDLLMSGRNNNYRNMFGLSSEKTDPDEAPKYYLDGSKTTTATITELIPNERNSYLTNRTGITDYENIDNKWK